MNGTLSVSSFCEVCSAVSVDFLGAVFACGYSGVRIAAVFEKLVHFLAFVVKVGVVTAEASQSEKLREWMAFFTFKNTIIHLFVPPKCCISIVFSLFWDHSKSQERINTILMQNFGGTNREYYGIFESGLFDVFLCSFSAVESPPRDPQITAYK